jgi:hypothetical protein
MATLEITEIEKEYDDAVKKLDELGDEQRKIVADAIKKLEERKMDELKKRLMPPQI